MLTDKEIERIVDGLEKRMVRRFYVNVGKGIWGLAWKGFVGLLLVLAAYGAGGGFNR